MADQDNPARGVARGGGISIGMTAMDAREWALRYASLGWRVFPVIAGGKRPLYAGWQRDATTDPEQIARYWRHEPGPNIGVVTGEAFDVVDIEAPHVGAFATWLSAHGYALPETPIAKSGRGGVHILVRAAEPFGGRNLHLDGRHVGELKSTGGLILVCPSRTAGPYVWLRSPLDGPLADETSWLLPLLARSARGRPTRRVRLIGSDDGRRRLEALGRVVARAPEGRRNNVLYWAANRAFEAGLPAYFTGLVLLRASLSAGLVEREAQATIRSAWQNHRAAP